MKKTLYIIFILITSFAYSQVTIGNNVTPTNNSVILEFDNDGDKGIIIPYTNGEIPDAVPGTFIFDAVANRAKFKLNTGWNDLSGQTGVCDLSEQTGVTESTNAKVIIGATSSSANGILVLESPDKAMVLPIVNSYTDIVNPSTGMIVYVKTNKRLAVFNGTVWSFWKP